jgi:hypothetical protein
MHGTGELTMLMFRDSYAEEVDGKYIEKPLFVTIALEEYRSLVMENARNEERIHYLENRLIEETEKRLKAGIE